MENKKLNPMIAAQLKVVLKRNDIRINLKREPGVDTWTVEDPEGKQLITYVNGWDYGLYSLSAFGRTVASMEWRESANKTTPEQAAVFEIGDLIFKKYEEQSRMERAMASMSEEDRLTLEMLQAAAKKEK